MKMSIGVDLHKTQFTVCCLSEDRKIQESGIYPTKDRGYEVFTKKLLHWIEEGYEISVAVESTGNTRYFRNRLVKAGIEVKIVNTVKFKVVNESAKKTDKHDARTLAEFLEKDMLPESILCSQESEDIRRFLKSRSVLVKALVSLKNQVHGLLLGYGIESRRGQLQSKKERQRILDGLADHKSYGNAARAVKPLLDTIDQIAEDVALLQTIPGVGLITAATVRAYTDDINRYESAKKYAAHAGLVPWVQNSNRDHSSWSYYQARPCGIENSICPDGNGDASASGQDLWISTYVSIQNHEKKQRNGEEHHSDCSQDERNGLCHFKTETAI